MSGYVWHILAYWLMSAILFVGLSHMIMLTAQQTDLILLSVFVGTVYAILPDIDTPNSLIRRFVEKTALVLVIILLVGYLATNYSALIYAALVLVLLLLFLWTMKHRGVFHTLPAGFVLSLPLFFLGYWFMGFAFLGYATHLFVDKIS
jgi:hypothetical protein